MQHAWTAQQLKVTIAAERPQPANHAGRPAKAALIKWLQGLQKASGHELAGAAFAAAFAALVATLTATAQNP